MKSILTFITAALCAGPALAQPPSAATPPVAAVSAAAADANKPETAAVPPKIPLRDFFKNPVSRGYDLSPDGQTLSFLQPWESRMNIFIRPTAGGEAKRLTNEKDRDIRNYAWKGNGFVVYAMDDKGDENFHLKRVDLKSGEVKDLTPFPKVRSEIIDDLADVSETDVLITLNKRNPEVFDAFRLNVATGEMKMVAQNPGKVDRWITDHAGVIRAATQTDGVNTSLLTRPDEKTPFKMVLTTNFREAVNPQFFTFDNKNLYATSNIGRDKAAVVTIDPSNGKELEKLYENPDVDVDALAYSKKRKVVTFAAFDTWKTERKFFDKQSETMYKTLAEKLPGYEVEVVANDKAEDKFIVVASNDRSPGSRNLFDAKTGDPDETGGCRAMAQGKRTRADETDRIQKPRRPDDSRLPHAPARPRGEEPAGGDQPARRSMVSRHLGLQSRGAVSGQPRLRRAPDELPRLDRLRSQVLGGFVQTMGPGDAG